MQFDLTDEQKLLAASIAQLLERVDKKGTPLARFDAARYADEDLWPPLRELAICGSLASTESGGLGDELLTLAMAAETLAYGAAGSPVVQQTLAAWLLSETDADDAVVAGVVDGTRLAAFALCETHDCWSPQQWRLAGARLTGEKICVIGGMEADLYIVGLNGGRFALVENGTVGLLRQAQSSLDRTRPLAKLCFEDAVARLLAGPVDLAPRLFDALLICTAADACGAMRRALDLCVDYAKTRRQFDRPIGSFQAVKHQLANMALDVEPCRALVWYAAHAWDRLPAEASRSAALAKAHVTDVAVRTGRAAVEVHGAMGYSWEYPLHLWLKRAIFDYGFMGGIGLHRARAADLAGW
jgi:alkylation response protein AidB-like acyl-CoA dehydrogenase